MQRDTSPSGPNLVTPGIKDDWVYGLQMSNHVLYLQTCAIILCMLINRF